MKIAVVVHGRFHAFDLARALIRRGNDVTVFTNYPKWAVRRFGIDPRHVRSCWWRGVLFRIVYSYQKPWKVDPQPLLNPMFERWTIRELLREEWDIVHVWSGIAEGVLTALRHTRAGCLLLRGSTHIRAQSAILLEEESRTGVRLDRPSPWIVERRGARISVGGPNRGSVQFCPGRVPCGGRRS